MTGPQIAGAVVLFAIQLIGLAVIVAGATGVVEGFNHPLHIALACFCVGYPFAVSRG